MNNLLIDSSPQLGLHAHLGPDLQATLWHVLSETLARLRANTGPDSGPVSVAAPPPRLAAAPLPVRLSQREREVLQRIAAGDSNKVIARAFDLSLHTVKRHVANILDKLGASSRGQAAAWWRAQA